MFNWIKKWFTRQPPVEERWKHPKQCDLCGEITPNPWEENIFPPDFTFTWCVDCVKHRSKECDEVMAKAINDYWLYREEWVRGQGDAADPLDKEWLERRENYENNKRSKT